MGPNILIFMVDEMQCDVTLPESPCILPTIKRFAKEGLTFSRCFTPSPHCCPSRATFMTGLYPSRHGIWNNVNNITAHRREMFDGITTFSEQIAKAGYDLFFAGKWHVSLKRRPNDCGWQELAEPLPGDDIQADSDPYTQAEPRGSGSARIHRPGWGDIVMAPEPSGATYTLEENFWYTGGVAPAAEKLRTMSSKNPWCLFVSTDMDPNIPAPLEYLDAYDIAGIELPKNYRDAMTDKPNIYRRLRSQLWDQLSEDDAKSAMRNYWALCMREDAHFKILLDALDDSGQKDNTLVLFISDHGDYNFAHGLQFMGIPAFREAYHIPAIVRWPRGIERPGRVVDAFVSLADFAPTFLELAGAPGGSASSGASLAPFLRGKFPIDWRDAMFTQTNGNEVYFTQRGVITSDWKYVYNAFDFDEMYDLRNDPHELVNLIHPSCLPKMPNADPSENPWPHLPTELNVARKALMKRIWEFAFRENDLTLNPFPPVAMASFGPGIWNT